MSAHAQMPRSAWVYPALAVLLFAATMIPGVGFSHSAVGYTFAVVLLIVLFGTVFAAVHHAEVIAHRIGEPYGTLVLTLSVTIIEVAMIASIMLGEKAVPTLARDTVFAVVMIVCNGLIGWAILAGGVRFREQEFQVTGVKVYLCVLIVISTITLVLPNYTSTTPGPVFASSQLIFIGITTLLLYCVFVYTQTVLHRDYFILGSEEDGGDHAVASSRAMGLSALLLLVSLVAVVLLAKKFSLVIDAGAAAIGAPPAFAGVVVALLILMPEGVAALAAARKNDLQKSINLALGSSLATIGLTVPVVAVAAYVLKETLVLGLDSRDVVLLVMTLLVSMMTFATGRTNVLFGLVHLVIFAVYIFFVLVP
ncbi:MAG TPA: ionic transporter y4hA [Afipia sp.]